MTALSSWGLLSEKQKAALFEDACRTGFDRRVDLAAAAIKRDFWGLYAIHPKKGMVRNKRDIAETVLLIGQQPVAEVEQDATTKTLRSIVDMFEPRGSSGFGC